MTDARLGLARHIRHLLELIRFSHTLFAMPFALLAAALAAREEGKLRWLDWAGVGLCMVFARSVAMAFNRLADHEIDAENPRTAIRHLPRGLVTRGAVWTFLAVCSVAFVASTGLFWVSSGNRWPLVLSLPVLVFVCGYSYAKRFTVLSHFWLGTALALAPVAAWIAIRGTVEWPPVVLGAAVLFWVAGFDMIYACQDVEFDRRSRLHSVPAQLGVRGALRLAAGCHVVTMACLFALPLVASLGWVYLAGVTAVAGLLVYEHLLVRPDDLTRVNLAFFQVNAVVSLGLLAVGLADLWLAKG